MRAVPAPATSRPSEQRELYVDCDIDHGAGYGNTLFWEATNTVPPYVPKAAVQFDLNTERFYRIYIDLMTRPARGNSQINRP